MKNLLKKWKKWRRAACCLAAAAAFAFAMPGAEAKEKVLLDADMVEMFDDGVAMMILERSAETELLGVTVVTGNTWAEDGVAFTIRQLEGSLHCLPCDADPLQQHPVRKPVPDLPGVFSASVFFHRLVLRSLSRAFCPGRFLHFHALL